MTTLEEVFLSLEDDDGSKSESSSVSVEMNPDLESKHSTVIGSKETERSSLRIFLSLIRLRFLQYSASPASIVIQIVVPVALLIIAVAVVKGTEESLGTEDVINLEPELYKGKEFGEQDQDEAFVQFLREFTNENVEEVPTDTSYRALLAWRNYKLLGIFSGAADQVTLYFNELYVHSLPIMINAWSNYLATTINAGNIEVSRQSFKLDSSKIRRLDLLDALVDGNEGKGEMPSKEMFLVAPKLMIVPWLLGIALLFGPLQLATELIYDRENLVKNQLRICQVSFLSYYGASFVVQTIIMLIMGVPIVLVIVLFDLEALVVPGAIGIFIIFYILYPLPILLFVSCLSFIFKKTEKAMWVFLIAT